MFNVCRLVFFSNAAASAAAPASPTWLPDHGGASEATNNISQRTPLSQKGKKYPQKCPSFAISIKYHTNKLTVENQCLQAGVLLQRCRQRSSSGIAHFVV
jgi:hypothetical protein